MTTLTDRVAGAPITWGVDGSPGWGHLIGRDRVMSEMVGIGLSATELGPDGYLPTDAAELASYLERYDLRVIAGFVPAVLYREDRISEELEYVQRAAQQLASTGSKVLVLGPASHLVGYDTSVEMSDDDWARFVANLGRLEDLVAEAGLATALHPHWGMAIERLHHVERLFESTSADLCLDTGHLFVAGVEPVDIARLAPERIRHVHLKDVDADIAARVRAGDLGFRRGVIDGMFMPLGQGNVDVAGVIGTLEMAGYDGWYVLEQDAVLSAEPEAGSGPVLAAAESMRYLETVADALIRDTR